MNSTPSSPLPTVHVPQEQAPVQLAGMSAIAKSTNPSRSVAESASESTKGTSLEKGRRRAWQIALFLPCLILLLTAGVAVEPPQHAWQTTAGVLVIVLLLTASVTDLRWHKIPNWATYSACLWGIAINVFAQFSPDALSLKLGAVGLTDSLLGALVPLVFMVLLFSVTGGGAGDVKLTAALGALLGLSRVIDAILCSFIVAGVIAVLRAVWLQGPGNLLSFAGRSLGCKLLPGKVLPPTSEQQQFMKQPMPLGPSFAIGTLIILLLPTWEPGANVGAELFGQWWTGE